MWNNPLCGVRGLISDPADLHGHRGGDHRGNLQRLHQLLDCIEPLGRSLRSRLLHKFRGVGRIGNAGLDQVVKGWRKITTLGGVGGP